MTTSDPVQEPRALVVFESMFGNTERVGCAVAQGLELVGVKTAVYDVSAAPQDLPPSVELLVVGAPTHAFSLSRPSTRSDAVRQGAKATRADTGLREWLGSVRPRPDVAMRVAVFDTRVSKVRRLPAAAGRAAARLAKRRGLSTIGPPAAFLVDDVQGPLLDGELGRATTWGKSLAAHVLAAHVGDVAP
jgi:hypothetical protein